MASCPKEDKSYYKLNSLLPKVYQTLNVLSSKWIKKIYEISWYIWQKKYWSVIPDDATNVNVWPWMGTVLCVAVNGNGSVIDLLSQCLGKLLAGSCVHAGYVASYFWRGKGCHYTRGGSCSQESVAFWWGTEFYEIPLEPVFKSSVLIG